MALIQEFSYNGKGFLPVMFEKEWQVAILNYTEDQHVDAIDRLDVHFETDEVFILLDGDACLITADKNEDSVVAWEVVRMKKNIVYNIPAHCWHNIAMNPGSSVAIVEKSYTHNGDFEFYYLKQEEKEEMLDLLKEEAIIQNRTVKLSINSHLSIVWYYYQYGA